MARLAPSARLRPVLIACSALALGLVAAGGGYWMLRDSSAFAVNSVVVEGADERTRSDARDTLERELRGASLLALSPAGLAARLRELPSVRQAHVDRDFPSTVRVTVWAERPVAVARLGTAKLLVSSTGRVIRVLGDSEQVHLPRVWLLGGAPPQAGELLSDPFARQSVAALAALPSRFGSPIQKAEADREHGIVLTLTRGGTQIRLGPPFDLRQKLRAAARLLIAVPPGDFDSIAYLDVRAPRRPALRSDGGDPETASLVIAADPADVDPTDGSATSSETVPADETSGGAEATDESTQTAPEDGVSDDAATTETSSSTTEPTEVAPEETTTSAEVEAEPSAGVAGEEPAEAELEVSTTP